MRTPYSNSLYEYYDRLSRQAFEKRQARIDALSSKEEALAYIQEKRAAFQKVFHLPPRPEVTFTKRGEFVKDGIVIERLAYRTAPHHWVTALFFHLPDITNAPGALVVCGHSWDGKLYAEYQIVARTLASKGFAVLELDPIGQGEMHEIPGIEYDSTTVEHNYLGVYRHLEGKNLCTDFLFDAMCGIDCLLAQKGVRPGKVAVTGHSGGGQMSYMLYGLDDRVEIAAPSCHMNTYRRLFQDEISTDSESSPFGIQALGLDRPDFAILGLPKPILFIGQENDNIDSRGLLYAMTNLRKVAKLLGKEECLQMYMGGGKHSYTPDARHQMLAFFTQYYFGKVDAEEPAMDLLTPEEANVAPQGSALNLPDVISIPEQVSSLWNNRSFTATPQTISCFLAQALQIERLTPAVPAYDHKRLVRLAPDRVCSIWTYSSEPGTPVISVLHRMEQSERVFVPAGTKTTLLVAENDAESELEKLPDEIFALDVRGVGKSESTAGNPALAYHHPFGREYFMEVTSEMLGKSLAGGRVLDILTALSLLRDRGYTDITLEGHGIAALLVAYAAALGKIPGVSTLRLVQAPESLVALLSRREFSIPQAYLLRGLLQWFDFPQLYQVLSLNYKVDLCY